MEEGKAMQQVDQSGHPIQMDEEADESEMKNIFQQNAVIQDAGPLQQTSENDNSVPVQSMPAQIQIPQMVRTILWEG